jgi:hypothetical protein
VSSLCIIKDVEIFLLTVFRTDFYSVLGMGFSIHEAGDIERLSALKDEQES